MAPKMNIFLPLIVHANEGHAKQKIDDRAYCPNNILWSGGGSSTVVLHCSTGVDTKNHLNFIKTDEKIYKKSFLYKTAG